MHVVDIQNVQESNANKELQEINNELKSFDNELGKKKQYIIFNKIDLISKENMNIIKKKFIKHMKRRDIFYIYCK